MLAWVDRNDVGVAGKLVGVGIENCSTMQEFSTRCVGVRAFQRIGIELECQVNQRGRTRANDATNGVLKGTGRCNRHHNRLGINLRIHG